MNLYKFFTLSLIFISCFSLHAQDANNEIYNIEIVIFEQLELVGNEKLKSQNLNLENINTITLQDKVEITLNEKSIIRSFDFEENMFSVDLMPTDNLSKTNKIKNKELPESAKLFSSIDKSKWFEKKSRLDQLDNIFRRLDRRKEYKVLHKQSWIQPALPKDKSPYIHEIFDNNGVLIKLYQSRYLHLDVIAYLDGNLDTYSNQKVISKIKLDALKNSIPNEVKNYNIKIDPELFQIDEIVKPKINADNTIADSLLRLDEVKYLLQEERRIFKNEVHYFDHPKIGVIISVYDSSL